MEILRSIDIEEEVRTAIEKGNIKAYCRPFPKKPTLPNVLVQRVGGTDKDTIDTFQIALDARASTEAEADLTIRNAIGVLRQVAKEQTTAIRHIEVNTSGSWGKDPVRPDLAMCSARLIVTAHQEKTNI